MADLHEIRCIFQDLFDRLVGLRDLVDELSGIAELDALHRFAQLLVSERLTRLGPGEVATRTVRCRVERQL